MTVSGLKRKREETASVPSRPWYLIEYFVGGRNTVFWVRGEEDEERVRRYIADLFLFNFSDGEEEEEIPVPEVKSEPREHGVGLLPLRKISQEPPDDETERPGGRRDTSFFTPMYFLVKLWGDGYDTDLSYVRRVACELSGRAEWIGIYGQRDFQTEITQMYTSTKLEFFNKKPLF